MRSWAKFRWRGNGWLRIASSHWEILGFGCSEQVKGKLSDQGNASGTNFQGFQEQFGQNPSENAQWVVLYAEKTIFSPAALSISTQSKQGVPEQMFSSVVNELQAMAHEKGGKALKMVALVQSVYKTRRT